MPGALSVGICVIVGVGPRYETSETSGISHFLEHMLFKGTEKRPTRKELMIAIEGIGGVTNAQTKREVTSYWIKTLKNRFEKGLEIIIDMILHSRIDPHALEREKMGILAQINRRRDFPNQHIWDLLFQTAWPNHPLGQEGLGNKAAIQRLTREVLLNYKNKFYVPKNIVIAVAGDIDHKKVTQLVNKLFDKKHISKIPRYVKLKETQNEPQLTIVPQDIRQSYLMLGLKTFSNRNPNRFTIWVLNSLLTAGFSSRLYLNAREKEGLLFSPQSRALFFQDTGLLTIQAQTKRVKGALKAILKELKELKNQPISGNELRLAKEKYKARLLFTLESAEKLAEWYGLQLLLQPKVLTLKETIAQIEAVTPNDIRRVANLLFVNSRLNLAVVGPVKNKEEIKKELNLN